MLVVCKTNFSDDTFTKISILRNAFEMILNFTIIYEYYGIGILLSQEKKEMGILSSFQCKMQKLVTIPRIIGKKKNGRQPPPKINGR